MKHKKKKLFQPKIPFMLKLVWGMLRLLFTLLFHFCLQKFKIRRQPATTVGIIGSADGPTQLWVGITPHLIVQWTVILLSALATAVASVLLARELRD